MNHQSSAYTDGTKQLNIVKEWRTTSQAPRDNLRESDEIMGGSSRNILTLTKGKFYESPLPNFRCLAEDETWLWGVTAATPLRTPYYVISLHPSKVPMPFELDLIGLLKKQSLNLLKPHDCLFECRGENISDWQCDNGKAVLYNLSRSATLRYLTS